MVIRGKFGFLSKGITVLGVFLIAFSFCLESIAQEEAAEDKPKDIFDLIIPSSWGRVKEIYKGSSKEVIVHIQDAHANYEAQTNISNILDLLVEDYGLTLAGVEGSVGLLQTDLFATYPEDTVRHLASDFLVKDGTFSGPEALVISKGFEYPLKLYGIEDEELYNNNLEAFKTSLPFKEEALSYFNALNRYLAELKAHIYNKQLNDIDAKLLAFELRIISLNDYCKYLNEQLKDKDNIKKQYPNFSLLLEAADIEETLNFAQAEEERTKLLTELTNILDEESIRKLLDKGLAYKNEMLSASLYLGFVKDLAQKNQVDFAEYNALDKYITYAANYDNIKSFELFNEIEELDAVLRSAVYQNDAQKKIDLLIRGLKVMRRMVEIKMVNKDLAFYTDHKDELKVDKYINFIKQQSASLGLDMDLPGAISYLDVYIPAWVDFYKVASYRDDAMINNTLSIMNKYGQRTAAMVTGGFHTRELTKKMQAKGISYLVITPRITENIQGPYFDRLTGKKTPYQSFLSGEISGANPVRR